MLQRMKDESRIQFLKNQSDPVEKKAEDIVASKSQKEAEESQRAKKLNNKDNGLMTSHHVSSARTGEIRDEGGPSKQLKMETSNTLFDPLKNSRLSKEADPQKETQKLKDAIVDNKRIAEQQRMDTLVDTIKETLQGKAADVTSAGTLSGSNYKQPKAGFSIFDNGDFQRLEDKTAGEKISEEVSKKNSQRDESWRSGGKSKTSKEAVSEYFKSIFEK